ncbi:MULTISPECIES: DUF4652 domain-containing protein [unclassified Bacillus cereus group]|uniref:DUF4652 domain-containing protein n=1 Tax=unclassified Bacillus cereus group TaxID=2750818 RepID=UPI001F562037|nr:MULTISPECIES: DUF4652 domain-containing protein [unclassified Bacillus cereus group]
MEKNEGGEVMYKLRYKRSDNQIELVTEQGRRKNLTNCISSKPKTSPGGLKAIYLAPFEWETLCSLYLVDLCTGKKQRIIGPVDEKYIPKDAVWISDTKIALIIGDVYGTISDGGDVYVYNFIDDQLCKLTSWNQWKQAVKLEYIEGTLYYEYIEYIGDDIGEEKEFIRLLNI